MQRGFDGKTAVERSIELMQDPARLPPEGYWLGFSGGKDSVVLLELAKRAHVKFDAHYTMTTVDPPELVRLIRTFSEVQIDRPPRSFYSLMVDRGFPLRTARWCCDELKERGGDGRVVMLGVRAAESPARAHRRVDEDCKRHPSRRLFNPMLHWTTAGIWEFIRSEEPRYCSLYDEGFKRLGCVICPFERHVQRSMERWPRIWAATKRSMERWFARGTEGAKAFRNFEHVWAWWTSRDAPSLKETGQLCLFGAGGQGWEDDEVEVE